MPLALDQRGRKGKTKGKKNEGEVRDNGQEAGRKLDPGNEERSGRKMRSNNPGKENACGGGQKILYSFFGQTQPKKKVSDK